MRNHKKSFFVLLIVLSVAIVTAMATLRRQNSNTSTQDEPTPLQDGILTNKQKAHGKLFKHGGQKLRDLARKQSGDVTVSASSPLVVVSSEQEAPVPFLQSAACNADAIVIGALVRGESQFTEDGKFIFTDYEMAIEDVIKNNATAPINSQNSITVTREGGQVQLAGRTFRASLEYFKPFRVSHRYLLYLKFVPATSAYLAYPFGSFQLLDQKVEPLGDLPVGSMNNINDSATFLTDVRAAATQSCNN